jgi:hypothetical protein
MDDGVFDGVSRPRFDRGVNRPRHIDAPPFPSNRRLVVAAENSLRRFLAEVATRLRTKLTEHTATLGRTVSAFWTPIKTTRRTP